MTQRTRWLAALFVAGGFVGAVAVTGVVGESGRSALASASPSVSPASPASSPSPAARDSGGTVTTVTDGEAWSREVWACDRRKLVVVEGVRAGERMPRARAERVAEVLQDLMRFCNEEITAHLAVDERITITARGRVYENYVPGGALPIVPASYGEPTRRERLIWDAALKQQITEGDRLFHSDEIGTNGIACAMCHPHAAGTHPETYPKFQTQLKKVALLRDMVNWCILNPLEGEELAAADPRMLALEAYMLAQRNGHAIEVGKH